MVKKFLVCAALFIAISLTVASVSGVISIASVFGERVVFENSFQYKKGMESRALVLQAQIAQISADMVANPDMYDSLQAQKKVLEIQLRATKL